MAGAAGVGRVWVLYGSAAGNSTTVAQPLTLATGGMPGDPATGDGLGGALTAGDFNNDGFDDLALGVPGKAVGDTAQAGTVTILFGRGTGIVPGGRYRRTVSPYR